MLRRPHRASRSLSYGSEMPWFILSGLIRGHLRSVIQGISLFVRPGCQVEVRIAGSCLWFYAVPVKAWTEMEALRQAWPVCNAVDRRPKTRHAISHTGA